MGGFAALIGGLGSAAQDYGQQIRGLQERQRESYMGMLQNEAQLEDDPEHRASLYQGMADLASGKPVSYVNDKVAKSRQKRDQANLQAGVPHVQAAIQGILANQGGQAQPGPGQYAGVPPGMLPPGAAAQPQTSPVNPLVQMGQQAGALSPQLPEAGTPPWAFTPDIAGTSLPPSQEQTAGLQAAGIPQVGGPQATPLPQASTGPLDQNVPFKLDEYLQGVQQQAESTLRGMTPHMQGLMGRHIQDWADTARQLGVARVQMDWRRQQAGPAIAEMDQVLTSPDSSALERMAARAAKMQAQEWIAGGGAAPAFPLTASTMLRAQEPVYHIEDATRMSPPDKQARGIPPEVEGPVIMGLPRMGGGPGQFYGQAPPHYQVGWTLDQNFNPVPMSFSPQLPNQPAQPIAGGPGGSPLQPTPQLTPRLVPLNTGELAYQSAAAARLGGKPFTAGGISVPMQPRYGETYQDIPQPDGSVLRVPMRTYRGLVPGAAGASATSRAQSPQGVGAPQVGPTGGVPPTAGPPSAGSRSFTKTLSNQLTLGGGKTVATVDAVLAQIDDAQKAMEKFGLDKVHDRGYWWDDYWGYKQSGESKYGGLWTNLSFTDLRSAAAALAGTNSRAYPIILRALAHTPTLEPEVSLNPTHPEIPKLMGDTPAGMYNKLNEMRVLLKEAREAAMEDEKKSGVVPISPPAATGGATPQGAAPPSAPAGGSHQIWKRGPGGGFVRQ